jgi:glutamyl-tRNA reductase
MRLSCHGITYHDCPIEARERMALSDVERHSLLRRLHAHPQVREAAVLQTCNRLEFYLFVSKDLDEAALLVEQMRQQGTGLEAWRQYARHLTGLDAVRHLFEVAAGLDSQMIGENQIVSQVKAAYSEALAAHTSRLIFHRLFHLAFRAAKAVRTQTDINCGAVSVGLAAVELAKARIDLSKSRAMVIGAGENAQLVSTHLVKAGVAELIIANRDTCRAQDLASQFAQASAIGLRDLAEALARVDLVISSTAAEEPVVTCDMVGPVLSGRRQPLLILDVAVPRDIDPKVGELPGVTLRNIDDLGGQVDLNRAKRSQEIPKARAIVDQFVAEFEQWYEALSVVPVIVGLTEKGTAIARREAERYAGQFCPQDRDRLALFAESVVRKILHEPIRFIKEAGGEPTAEQLRAIDLMNRMFRLQDGSDD